MYTLKQIPEDFKVKETIKLNLNDRGRYSYFKLTKKNMTTIHAIETIANKLHKKTKDIGFAGNKDKKAITQQMISISNLYKIINLKNEKIKLELLGKGDEPISLGDLDKNEFEIVVRNLTKDTKINKLKQFPNYFGEQRFSKNNKEIGKALIKKDFKTACQLILENKGFQENKLQEHLTENKTDYINALRQINKKILQIYVHAYQSYLFNKTIQTYLKNKDISKIKNSKVPIVGFGNELEEIKNSDLKKIIINLIKTEKINQRDFIIREIQGLSSEGTTRNLFAEIINLKISKLEKDELNKGKFRVKLDFKLPKGCYATVAVKELLI